VIGTLNNPTKYGSTNPKNKIWKFQESKLGHARTILGKLCENSERYLLRF